MEQFMEEEKKYIVGNYGRNYGLRTKVRLYFLQQFGIKSNTKMSHYKVKDFMRVNQDFDRTGSLVKTQVKRSNTKRNRENLEKIEQVLDNQETFLVRCLAPKHSIRPTVA